MAAQKEIAERIEHQRTNYELERRVRACLNQLGNDCSSRIAVIVSEGNVMLTGRALDHDERLTITEAVRKIDGVRQIDDQTVISIDLEPLLRDFAKRHKRRARLRYLLLASVACAVFVSAHLVYLTAKTRGAAVQTLQAFWSEPRLQEAEIAVSSNQPETARTPSNQ